MLIRLPQKVCLLDATTALELTGIPLHTAIHTLLMYSREFKLPIHFNHEIHGHEEDKPVEIILDQQGEYIGTRVNEPAKYFSSQNKLTLLSAGEASNNTSNITIPVYAFIHQNKNYKSTDITQEWLKAKTIPFNNFYIDKSDLVDFIKSTSNSSISSNPPAKNEKIPILESRERALKNFLITKTNSSLNKNDENQFQELYNKLGSPTRKTLWKELQLIEPSLFNSGIDDFFKNQKILKFQIGTGKHR